MTVVRAAAQGGTESRLEERVVKGLAEGLRCGLLRPSDEVYEAARQNQRLIVGPWSHQNLTGSFQDRYYGIMASADVGDLTGEQLRWFDHWLKGEEHGVEGDKPVEHFAIGVDRAGEEGDSPPPEARYRDYFVHIRGRANTSDGEGSLSTEEPTDEPEDLHLYDSRNPVPTVGGATLLEARRTWDLGITEAGLMNPGEVYELSADLWATSNVILRGHRIRLEISSGNFPRFDRNTNTGGTSFDETHAGLAQAINRSHHDRAYPSRVVLPIVERERVGERRDNMPYAENGGVRIYYETEGFGPPMVLVHGFSDSLEGWREYGYNERLRKCRYLILIDARGHGASDKPHDPEAYGLAQRPADVVAVLDDLGTETADYCGYSLGGWIGLGLAIQAPERIRSLIVGGAQPYGQSMNPYREALSRGIDDWVAVVEKMAGSLSSEMRERLRRNDVEALLASVTTDRPDISADLVSRTTSPCLFYAGEADPLCPLVERCASELRDASFFSVPGLNHIQGAIRSDLVLLRLTGFLAEQDRLAGVRLN